MTARKKPERLQDVPLSVTALDGDALQKNDVDTFHEVAEFAPNVFATTDACCSVVYIRGFGSPLSPTGFEPSVGLAIDELAIPRDGWLSDPFYDLARIEILRGPQGTVFGKNTTAGLFQIVTDEPPHELAGYVLGRVGGLGVHREEAAIGGPIPALRDVAAVRLALVDLAEAGDVENTKLDVREPATKQHAARLKLGMRPVSGLDVVLTGERAVTDSRLFHAQQEHLKDSTVQFLRQFDPRFEDDPTNHQDSINQPHPYDRTTDRLQGNLRYAFGDLSWIRDVHFIAVLGHGRSDADLPLDVDTSPADILNLASPSRFLFEQDSAELRIAGIVPLPLGLGRLEVLAGSLLSTGKLVSNFQFRAGKDLDEYLVSAPGFELITGTEPPGGVGFEDLRAATRALGLDPFEDVALLEGDGARILLRQRTRSEAFFGHAGWHLGERWTVDFGARLTHETKAAHLVNHCFDPGVVCAALNIQEFDVHADRTETDVSPRAAVQYQPAENVSLFAARGQGFKSGGFNNLSFTPQEIEVGPEKAVSWEGGGKGTLFDGSVAYGATLFEMDVDDLQIQTLEGTRIVIRNAASARSRGLELDAHWLAPWKPLRVDGTAAFTDARFKRFPHAPTPQSSAAAEQDLSGRRMPFVSKSQLHLTPRLTFGLAELPVVGAFLPRDLRLTGAVDVQYRSGMFLRVDLGPHTRQPGYAMVDGRLGVTLRGERLWIGLAVENITNVDALEFVTEDVFFPGGFGVIQEFQRNYSLAVKYAW